MTAGTRNVWVAALWFKSRVHRTQGPTPGDAPVPHVLDKLCECTLAMGGSLMILKRPWVE